MYGRATGTQQGLLNITILFKIVFGKERKNIKQHTSPAPFRIQQDLHLAQEKTENSICPNCGEQINRLLFAVVDSDYIVEEYYACPHCLAKIRDISDKKTTEPSKSGYLDENFDVNSKIEFSPKIKEPERILAQDEEDEAEAESIDISVAENKSKPAGCGHYSGYLKTRPKNTSIPDECLTCSEMINCMMH